MSKELYARKCDVTGKGMNEGYCYGDGEMYFSEEKYLIKHIRDQGVDPDNKLSDEYILKEAYEQEEYYYTEWEIDPNEEVYDTDGNEVSTNPREFLKYLITQYLGEENFYTGSADLGGVPVWTVKGDKFTGRFIGIDDSDNVFYLHRKLEDDEYSDKTINTIPYQQVVKIEKLLKKLCKNRNKPTLSEVKDLLNGIINKINNNSIDVWNDSGMATHNVVIRESFKRGVEETEYVHYNDWMHDLVNLKNKL